MNFAPVKKMEEFTLPSISATTRFEVMTRDQWTCQYCGRCAPQVALTVERVRPIIDGGSRSQLNLFTCCTDCAHGRRAAMALGTAPSLPGANALAAPPAPAAVQTPAYWREELVRFREGVVERICQDLGERAKVAPSPAVQRQIKDLVLQHGTDTVWLTFQSLIDGLLASDDDGVATDESIDLLLSNLGRMCSQRVRSKEFPHERRLLLIRGVLRARLVYVSKDEVLDAMVDASRIGIPVDLIERLARESRSWGDFWNSLYAMMRD